MTACSACFGWRRHGSCRLPHHLFGIGRGWLHSFNCGCCLCSLKSFFSSSSNHCLKLWVVILPDARHLAMLGIVLLGLQPPQVLSTWEDSQDTGGRREGERGKNLLLPPTHPSAMPEPGSYSCHQCYVPCVQLLWHPCMMLLPMARKACGGQCVSPPFLTSRLNLKGVAGYTYNDMYCKILASLP